MSCDDSPACGGQDGGDSRCDAKGCAASRPSRSRRFAIGATVLCKTGEDCWLSGRVTAVDYREDCWPPGQVKPYVVELDDKSDTVFVHRDSNDVCREAVAARSTEPWWHQVFAGRPGSYFARGAFAEAQELQRQSDGRRIDEQNGRGETALIAATRYCWMAGIRELLVLRANPDLANDLGQSPLHLALIGTGREAEVVGMLLEARAHPSQSGSAPDWLSQEYLSQGEESARATPLQLSAASGMLDVSRALVEARADMDAHASGETPLRMSIAIGHEEVTELLFNAGADVDAGPENGETLLMEAARHGDVAFARKLLGLRADANRTGKQDLAPLHMAARGGHASVARLLLEYGADQRLRSRLGSPLDLAARFPEVSEILNSAAGAGE